MHPDYTDTGWPLFVFVMSMLQPHCNSGSIFVLNDSAIIELRSPECLDVMC